MWGTSLAAGEGVTWSAFPLPAPSQLLSWDCRELVSYTPVGLSA